MLMRFNVKMRWPEMGFIEFLWKLVATVVVFGIIGILTANHAESGSALQGFSYFVVGSCALVGVVSISMLPQWPDYVAAITNLTGQNLTYSLMDIPLASIGLVAWIARADLGGRRRLALP